MGAGEQEAAHLPVELEAERLDGVEIDGRLPVPELANVEVAPDAVDRVLRLGAYPAEEDVARRLHQALPVRRRALRGCVRARAEVRLEHRRLRLLDLEEERVVAVASEQQEDPAAGSDAADADHLPREIDPAELLEQMPAIGLQRLPVLAEEMVYRRLDLLGGMPASAASSAAGTISGGSETMRGSPSTSCVSFAKAFRLSFVLAFSAACTTVAAWRPAFRSARFRSSVSASRCAYQTSRLRATASFRIQSRYERDRREHGGRPLLRREVAVAAGDLEARGEPLQVPLERARDASRRSR